MGGPVGEEQPVTVKKVNTAAVESAMPAKKEGQLIDMSVWIENVW